MRILLLCVDSSTVKNFRLPLIRKLIADGYEVFVSAFDDIYVDEIKKTGCNLIVTEAKRRSINPFSMFDLINKYKKLIKEILPDKIFTFMAKPNTFGVKAARKAGVKKIFSMVEGAGDVFINNGIKWKAIRYVVCKMYRSSFKKCEKIFFLNNDDKDEFIARKLVKENQCIVIPGIGVDVEYFAYRPIKNYRTFLMVARMLKTKGVIEYCKAARIVKQKYPDATFNYLGAEGTIKITDIQEYIEDGSINYLGTTEDVRPYYEDCTALVLPTYREGFPVSVMEAMACGRAVIGSDTNGCRDAICNENTGFLVPVGDEKEIAEKIIWCIENPQKVKEFGTSSRKLAEERFNQKIINEKILEIIGV